MSELHAKFFDKCVGLDIEVEPETSVIFAMAAVKNSTGEVIDCQNRQTKEFLNKLETMLGPSDYLIGQNLIKFDLEHLKAKQSDVAKYLNRSVDTLWLNPLAFPRETYHFLRKPHLDPTVRDGQKQDPELDSRLAIERLERQQRAFKEHHESLIIAYHFLATRRKDTDGFDAFFCNLRDAATPNEEEGLKAIHQNLNGLVCHTDLEERILKFAKPNYSWALAYALSWMRVAEDNIVLPPWVINEFPKVADIARLLRATACGNASCRWCKKNNESKMALKRWFGYDEFRAIPKDADGKSLQYRIVSEAMRGNSLIGILPTGTGKSICYQIPALANYHNIGALTVVISPLVALMSDQIAGLKAQGIDSATTINGNLSMAERSDRLDKVRRGDISILIISPEQLRNTTIRSTLEQRIVGLWVLDEAHCVSKWGHDFRPDYRYVSRFIDEFYRDRTIPQIICLTATAKPEVIKDIEEHFVNRLKIGFMKFNGGASRENLTFKVKTTTKKTKATDILDTIGNILPNEGKSGSIVYCSTRRNTEKLANFLIERGFAAAHFHARLKPEKKIEVQEMFRNGELRVVVATNAFGMGIDKPDIRLVVHADIPGSLENYLQEAGRAGRDGGPAQCVLFFVGEDIDKQFSLTAKTMLKQKDIEAILKSIRGLRKIKLQMTKS